LGLRPDVNGLKLEPAIPSDWKGFTMDKVFRGKKLHIQVENPNGAEGGYKACYLNGEKLESNYIPAEILQAENQIRLEM
ncbi:MAG: hypothetical protein J6F30_06320, partial [Cellulosilyticum sp.]|nr:hypothetical protein [Cellulosilyticum sp.]